MSSATTARSFPTSCTKLPASGRGHRIRHRQARRHRRERSCRLSVGHRSQSLCGHSGRGARNIRRHGSIRREHEHFALYDTRETASPMAEAVFDLWCYGQSAYIPRWRRCALLYAAREVVNPVLEKCGGDILPTDSTGDCWYWTSTEVEGQQTAKAWLYSIGSGAMQETPKTQAHRIRPIITLNN